MLKYFQGKQMAKNQKPETSIVWIQLVLAYEWLQSGWGKFAKPDFMAGIDKTLASFSSKTQFDWYGSFLGKGDAQLFGNITRFSEVLIGLGLLLGAPFILKKSLPKPALWLIAAAAFGGFILNLNLYLAAGWSSPSASGINLVMGLTQLIIGIYYLVLVKKS